MTNSSLISATASKAARLALAPLMAGLVAGLVAVPQARAAADPPVAELLQHIGKQVEKFWTNFASVTCTESVNQSKLGEKNKVLFVQRQTFDYLIALQSSGQEISVDESRVEKVRAGSKGTKVSLLETNGFGIFSLIFHPLYQSPYQFQLLPDEYVQNHRLICLNFQQVSRDHPLSVLRLRELEYPLEWRGKAWIDPVTWSVARIQAGLGDSRKDIGLLRLDADVTYSDVHFGGTAAYSLPALAIIDAETKRQHWHNTHAFTGYKRFTVDTDVKIGTPQ